MQTVVFLILIVLLSLSVGALLLSRRRRMDSERALRDAKEQWRTLVATMEQGVALLEMLEAGQGGARDWRFVEVNACFEGLVGKKRAELVGREVGELFPDLGWDWLGRFAGVVETGEPLHTDYYAPRIDRHYEVVGYRPRPGFLAVIMTDISRRRKEQEEHHRIEKQFHQAQKLESLGVLAGGIAHDFNNILMVVLGNAELARDVIEPDSPAVESLQEIETAVRRASDLCRQMLAYSGQESSSFERIDVEALVRGMDDLLRSSISKKATLQVSVGEDLPLVAGDAGQIRQILLNFVTNASESLEERSGVIAVDLSVRWCDAEYLADFSLQEQACEPGPYVVVAVADTGVGMSEDACARVFEPFFTTKFAGRGLGMAAAQGMARMHGGAIGIHSEEGRGTTVRLILPALEQEDIPASDLEACGLEAADSAARMVLLVDDEKALLEVAKKMLERLGYSVITAHHGREAVDIYRERKDEIDVVLLDLTMPEMNGDEALAVLKEINPAVRVIMTSGYNEDSMTRQPGAPVPGGWIHKPFTLAALKNALDKG